MTLEGADPFDAFELIPELEAPAAQAGPVKQEPVTQGQVSKACVYGLMQDAPRCLMSPCVAPAGPADLVSRILQSRSSGATPGFDEAALCTLTCMACLADV